MNHLADNSSLHRYNALQQAIDFFTQKFNISQFSSYAFEFTNDMVALGSSALFIKENDRFALRKSKDYTISEYYIEDNAKLQSIATLHGNVMTAGFENYFENHVLEAFKPKLIIPLIIKDLLYGFIISEGKKDGMLDDDDLLMTKALMQLINNSLESSKNLVDLQHINSQLDQKIFNLFSINQSSRILLSELDLNKLYALAIDIFSELTSSRITSFGLYDEIKDKIVLRGYRDVFSSNKLQMDFVLRDSTYNGYKVVFNYQKDKEQLQSIFENYEDFKYMNAEYIILMVKEQVLGFVTISKPVNDRAYDQALFELIESLAASTYISLKNAIYFNEIDRQRKTIQQKLHALTNLNTLVRNINSCATIDELCDISMKTLQYSFGFKKAFIALRDKDAYTIKNYFGFQLNNPCLDISDKWHNIESEALVSYMADAMTKYMPPELAAEIGDSNCLVISPLSAANNDIEERQLPLGYIVVLQAPQTLREEEVLLIETMSNSIAPIVDHLQEIKQMKKEFVPNQMELFKKSLGSKIASKNEYNTDFYIYYKKIVQLPFESVDLSPYEQYEYYYFSNMLIVISYDPLPEDCFDGTIEVNSVEDAASKLKNAYIQNI